MTRVGPEFSATGEQVNSTWQQLAGVYQAPEVGQLLAATGPVQTTAASVGEDIAAVGRALATYAATVKQIQNELDALRVQAQELVAEAKADKDSEGTMEKVGEFFGVGGDDDDYAERSNELTGQVNAQVAAFYEAQRTCANAINALYGGTQYRANDGNEHQDGNEFGYTAEQLDAAFEQGQELPWGSYAETDTGIVGGIWDGMKTFAGDLGALIGRDPVTGEWSWSTAGTAWKGLGTFVLAIGVYAMPGGGILDQTLNDGKLGNTLLNAGKGLIAYDEWGKGDNARAGGMAGFNILSAIVGTKGAGAALRGVGAGAQTSRIGLIASAGTAMVRTGEFIGRLPTVESLIARVSQHLPNLRLPGNIPDINVPHHIDTPRLDTPRVDTPNPGSIGDNLADTNRTPHDHIPPADHTPGDGSGSSPGEGNNGPSGQDPGESAPDGSTPDSDPQHNDPQEVERQRPDSEEQELIEEAQRDGVKLDPEKVVEIGKDPSGKTVFLEEGGVNPRTGREAGLAHVMKHKDEFVAAGIPEGKIAEVVHRAATEGRYTGYCQGKPPGRPIFEIEYGGQTHYVSVSVGNNGYIVGANMRSAGSPFDGAHRDPRADTDPNYRGWGR